MLLLKDKDEGDLIDCLILQHVLVPRTNDLLGLVHTHNLERMVQVRHRDLLNLQHIIRVENRLEVLRRQKLRLELIERVVVRISLVELLALDRLEHFEDGGLGVGRLLIQNVRHQFLFKVLKRHRVRINVTAEV